MAKLRPSALTYQPHSHLLTAGELRFYRTGLLPAIGSRYHVSMKVRLADVIRCDSPATSTAFRKIQSKHLDFLLLTKSFRIVAAIELNDGSHDHPDRQTRDAFVADALRSAGIPLIVFPIYRTYRPDVIAHHVDQALKRRAEQIPVTGKPARIRSRRASWAD
jgi:hypothetical protein